eukprot:g70315.t1
MHSHSSLWLRQLSFSSSLPSRSSSPWSSGWLNGLCSMRTHAPPAPYFILYILWGMIQHVFFTGFVLRMLLVDSVFPPALSVVVVALLFGMIHHPDRLLVRICALLYIWWGAFFASALTASSVPSVVWLGCAHGAMGYAAGLRPALRMQ